MSKLKIKWSLYAKKSLDTIVEYINQDSSSNAKMVKKTLISLAGLLNDFPEKFPHDPFIPKNKGNYRFVSKWNYKIVVTNLVKVNMIFRLTRTIFLANIILAKTQCPQSFKPARF